VTQALESLEADRVFKTMKQRVGQKLAQVNYLLKSQPQKLLDESPDLHSLYRRAAAENAEDI
jgi:hypothetical protein